MGDDLYEINYISNWIIDNVRIPNTLSIRFPVASSSDLPVLKLCWLSGNISLRSEELTIQVFIIFFNVLALFDVRPMELYIDKLVSSSG